MNKKRLALTVVVCLLFFWGSYSIFISSRQEIIDDALHDIRLEEFENTRYGYRFSYPEDWELRERDILGHFHSSVRGDDLPEIGINWESYRQVYRNTFTALSDFTHIDGVAERQIEHAVYPNNNRLNHYQWYDIFVLMEARSSRIITEAILFQRSHVILNENERIDENYNLYDPWTPRGQVLEIGSHEVLKVTILGDFRHENYQYYIIPFDKYFLVFHFGYGRTDASRSVWKDNNEGIRAIIKTLEKI